MRKEEFSTSLQQALQNLYDPPTLERSSLIPLVTKKESAPCQSAWRLLHHEILQAIEQLRPDTAVPAASPAWRIYEILRLRYVEGLIVKEMEYRLQLGGRQIRREIHRAVDMLTDYLWVTWGMQEENQEDAIQPPRQGSAASSISTFVADPQPQQLREMCESVLSILYQLKKAAPDQVQIDIPVNLPFIQVDRSLFRQMLLIALVKAVEGCSQNCVKLRASLHSEAVTFTIHAGPKEPDWNAQELISIIQLFIDSGVPVTRVLTPNQGTEFVFNLPLSQEHCILIIDDDENALHLYRRYLTGQPFHVITVANSASVLQTSIQEKPSVIILDVLLPGIDGWEVLQSLKRTEETSKIPVIICSALYQPDIAQSLGANDFLKKPVIQKDLLDVLNRWL